MASYRSGLARRGGAWGVSLIGIALVGSAFAYAVAVRTTAVFVYPLVDFLVLIALSSTVTFSGYWLGQSDIESTELWRIASFVGLGVIVMATLMAWNLLVQLRLGGILREPLNALVVTQTIGAVIGLLVGIYHVQTIRAAKRAERAEAAASEAREAREQLEFLNHLLRHHLLNGVQVIRSYSSLLSDHVDESGREHLSTIQRRSDRLVTLVDNIRVLAESVTEDGRLEPRDLDTAIEEEMTVVEHAYEDAVIEYDGTADSVYVEADRLLPAVFENLLRNAVEHNTASTAHVTIEATAEEDTAVVTIADNGPGISPGIEQRFLERTDVPAPVAEEGTGLYIANRLVDSYGGEIRVEKRDTDGACFVVELPVADVERDGSERTVPLH
jgi:signal transduction histidine kinase